MIQPHECIPGTTILYRPHNSSPAFRGLIQTPAWRLGAGAWVTKLERMEKAYRDFCGKRNTSSFVACADLDRIELDDGDGVWVIRHRVGRRVLRSYAIAPNEATAIDDYREMYLRHVGEPGEQIEAVSCRMRILTIDGFRIRTREMIDEGRSGMVCVDYRILAATR